MAGNILQGIAIARIAVNVGVPKKESYEGPLKAIHQSLVAFRNLMDKESHDSIRANIQDAEASLGALNDVSDRKMQDANNFELSQQRRYAKESATLFRDATDKASEIAKKSMIRTSGPMSNQFKIDADIQKKLKKDHKALSTDYINLKRYAKNYFELTEDEQSRMRVRLQQELEIRLRLKRQYEEEFERTLQKQAIGKEEAAAKDKQINKEVKRLAILQDQTHAIKEMQTWQKRADEATLRGAKNREKAIKDVTGKIKEWTQELKEAAKASEEWATDVIGRLNRKIELFTSILMESTIALTAFYYKINETVTSLMGFQQELQNAQSIFQTTYEVLFSLSDEVVEFGTQFGVSYDNAAKGLYQFASAGLTADESLRVLNDTLKLSMAVQGDHNTLSKLTTQIIYGFGLAMDDATEVTDKLAHSINKSLIEWQDLASSVKFALPFFISAGQNLEQLLGALEILTNRALEAGIAGRGLRQALAEFTQHAKDNEAAFHKLGVEILDTEGNMRELTDIALQFNKALGEDATTMEIMIALMEDLNVRGATAFIHLALNAEEYAAAVQDLQNATGAAHKMAMIQQMGLEASLQRLKNRFQAAFLFSDEATTAAGQMNTLTLAVQYTIDQLSNLIVVGEGAKAKLTDLGMWLKNTVIGGVMQFTKVLKSAIKVVQEWSKEGLINISVLKLYFLPLMVIIALVDILGPSIGKLAITLYVLQKTIGITTIAFWMFRVAAGYTALSLARVAYTAIAAELAGTKLATAMGAVWTKVNWLFAASLSGIAVALVGMVAGFYLFYKVGEWITTNISGIAGALGVLALMVALVTVAYYGLAAAAAAGSITHAWGKLGMAAGAGALGITAGAAKGYLWKDSGEDMLGTDAMDAYMVQLESRVSTNAALGGGATDLYVDNLITANDDLGERAYASSYTTTKNRAGLGSGTF